MIRRREIPSFVYDPSCVLYLPLWKRDGATFISDDAYGHLATVTGATWGIQGRTFDGIDDWIIIGDTPFDFERTSPFALEIWLKTATTDASSVFSKHGAPDYTGYTMEVVGTGEIDFNLLNDVSPSQYTQVRSTTQVNNNVWHHILCQNLALAGGAGSDIEIYIDGARETTSILTNTLGANSILNNVNLRLASRDAGGQPFNSVVGEAWVYNRTLGLLEARRNYLATRWRYQ